MVCDVVISKRIRQLLVKSLMLLIFCYAASVVFTPLLWDHHPDLWHTLFEGFCIFISLGIFMVVWVTYDRSARTNHAIGLGFLAVAVFELMHTCCHPNLGLCPMGYYDLSTWYYLFGRLTQVVVLLIGFGYCEHKTNKWTGLLLTLGTATGISYMLYVFYPYLPVLETPDGVTAARLIIDFSIILLSLILLYIIENRIEEKDFVTYRYVYLSLLLSIPAQLCLIYTTSNLAYIMGHILRIVFYAYLLRGIYVSAIIFPYQKMEDERKSITKVLDDIPTGIIRYDALRKLVFANRRALEIFGCNIDRIRHLKPQEMVKLLAADKSEDFIKEVTERKIPLKGMIREIKNCLGINFKIKMDYLQQDDGFLVLFDDVNKELALENLQLQTQTILNSVSNTILAVDRNNTIILCNKVLAEMVGVDIQEIVGLSISAFNERFSIDIKELPCNPETNIYGNLQKALQLSLVNKEGKKLEIFACDTAIYNMDGERIGTINVGTDVTLLNMKQQKLQQEDRLIILGQMAAGIVHEIKNPLAVIKGFSQIIRMKANDEKIREYMNLINIETERINKVVGDFLKFAKPRQPCLKKVVVSDLIESIGAIIDSNTYMKGIILDSKLGTGYSCIKADDEQIKQVILNIVQNAIEAMEEAEHPRLTIRSGYSRITGDVYIAIANNGKALTPEQKAKMGTPFYTTKEKGTGLGLSICYQIIKEHNGHIDITSEPGQDTVFTIYLPQYTDEQQELEKLWVI